MFVGRARLRRDGYLGSGHVGIRSVELAGDGDARLAESMSHLCFAEARGVVFERKLLSRIIESEASQAVGVGKFAEPVQLLVAQRGLQFVSNLHECHGGIIPAVSPI